LVSAIEAGFGVATCYRKQSLDGAWWEVCEPVVNAFQIGAKADYWISNSVVNPTPTDDQPFILAALGHFKSLFFPNRGRRTGYWLGAKIPLGRGWKLWGFSPPGDGSIPDIV